MTSEEFATLMGEHLDAFEQRMIERLDARVAELRGDLLERVIDIELKARSPAFDVTTLGIWHVNGRRVFDMRSLLKDVLVEVLPPKVEP